MEIHVKIKLHICLCGFLTLTPFFDFIFPLPYFLAFGDPDAAYGKDGRGSALHE